MIEDRGILEDTISLCHMRLIICKYFPSSFIRMILVKKNSKIRLAMELKRSVLSKQEKYSH